MDLHIGPGDLNLLDEQAHQLLALLEIKSIEPFANTLGEGFNFVRQLVVDREFVVLGQQCFALLLELAMAAEHLMMPNLEFGQIDRLHLIQVNESSSFCLGALQPTLQALELSLQELVIGLFGARAECRLALHQNLWPQQRLAQVLPDE